MLSRLNKKINGGVINRVHTKLTAGPAEKNEIYLESLKPQENRNFMVRRPHS